MKEKVLDVVVVVLGVMRLWKTRQQTAAREREKVRKRQSLVGKEDW